MRPRLVDNRLLLVRPNPNVDVVNGANMDDIKTVLSDSLEGVQNTGGLVKDTVVDWTNSISVGISSIDRRVGLSYLFNTIIAIILIIFAWVLYSIYINKNYTPIDPVRLRQYMQPSNILPSNMYMVDSNANSSMGKVPLGYVPFI